MNYFIINLIYLIQARSMKRITGPSLSYIYYCNSTIICYKVIKFFADMILSRSKTLAKPQVLPAFQAPQALQVLMDLKVTQAHRELKVHRETKVFRAIKENLVSKVMLG